MTGLFGAIRRGVAMEALVALNADMSPQTNGQVASRGQLLLDQHRHAHRATYIVCPPHPSNWSSRWPRPWG